MKINVPTIGARVIPMHVVKNLTKFSRKIKLPTRSGFELFHSYELMFIQADVNYSKWFVEGRNVILTSMTLAKSSKLVSDKMFIRCHQSYLVNADYINSLYQDKLKLKNGKEIPVSRRYRKHLLEFEF